MITRPSEFITPRLRPLWGSPVRGAAAMAAVALVSGLLAALLMPRGPITTWQAVVLVLLALLTGVAAGLLSGSRWGMVVVPVLHLLAFEVARLDEIGPTVDTILREGGFSGDDRLFSRGFFLFLILLPMVLGVSWGAAFVRHASGRGHAGGHLVLRRGLGWLSTALVVALLARILVPAWSPALTLERNLTDSHAITELSAVELNGTRQWIEIRAASSHLPVLLYLPPLPGFGTMPASRQQLEPLASRFVVVIWDMRGSGKSYAAFDPETLTVDTLIADTVALTNYLRERFSEDKIYLVAEWWGTLFSVLAAQQHPELYHAVVNSDQMVAPAEWEDIMYQTLLVWSGAWEPNVEAARDLVALGPPPYDDIAHYQQLTLDYSRHLTTEFLSSGPPGAYWYPGEEWFGWGSYGLDGAEYTLVDRVNAMRSRSDVFAVLYPQLREIDLREDVPSLDVPVYMLDAAQSYAPLLIVGRTLPGTLDLSKEWFDALDAPFKQFGRGLVILEPSRLLQLMERAVLPDTYPTRKP